MKSLDDFARRALVRLDEGALRRSLSATERTGGGRVLRGGRALISFSCNDYLGLAQDPRVKQAASDGLERYGAGAGGSRLVTGDHPLIGELEARLARHKGTPASLVFGSGYLANVGIPGALVGKADLILLDELSHACIWSGARLSGARVLQFPHNDVEECGSLLAQHRAGARHALVITESVFSMDGDLAPIRELAAVCAAADAWLMVDDAHGLGVVQHADKVPLDMGTLSKALGSYGGYLCASREVVDLVKNRARSFVYTTGLPPASAAAAIAALDIVEREPERCARPLMLAGRFTEALDLPAARSAIVPLILGSAERAMALSLALERAGFLAVAIRPPTVPPGTARLRFTFSAAHRDEDVNALVSAVTVALREQGHHREHSHPT